MKCEYCEIGCRLKPETVGSCRMYVNREGVIEERFPDAYLSTIPISIETLPMTLYRPKAKFLQVGGIGCNFKCPGCVSSLFTRFPEQFISALKNRTPDQVIKIAESEQCEGLVYCMNDPVAAHPTFIHLAGAARRAGLAVGCSSNLYHTPRALQQMAPLVDFVNCGLKGGTDQAYLACGAPGADPVFRNLAVFYQAGVHVEVSVMYIRGQENEVRRAAGRVADISPRIPFQIMRFIPFGRAALDQEPTASEAESLCHELRRTLSFVYLFNTPGTSFLDVVCPECQKVLLRREFFGPMGARTISSHTDQVCDCGHAVPINGRVRAASYQEKGMSGGYRFTRALEVIRAVCSAIGLNGDEDLIRVWRSVLENDDVDRLHDKINSIEGYLGLILELGRRFGAERQAGDLAAYIEDRVDLIREQSKGLARPSVYYAMTMPFFALNADRFEIGLVEAAGGAPVNSRLTRSGKPGVNILRDELLVLDPEFIFVSGLFSAAAADFEKACRQNDLNVKAVTNGRIHMVPAGWDFGNPRWILGLMFLANTLHPDTFHFDLAAEADDFYRRFYDSRPGDLISNRSFYQPFKAGVS